MATISSTPLRSRSRYSVLPRLRSPWIGWLQLLSVLVWTLQPLPLVNSYWHDSDSDGVPEFFTDPESPWGDEDADSDGLINSEESAYGSSPFLTDSDNDGLTDTQEYAITQALGGRLDPWDTDTDNDGLSDYADADPLYPMDTDGDGITDILDPFPWDPTNDTSWWSGGTFLINGAYVTFGPMSYATSQGAPDGDSDGIPDFADPYPGDPVNYSSWWEGGTYRISGIEQLLSGGYYGTYNPYDADSDGIPDSLDPFLNDATNNTALLASAYRWIDGTEQMWGDSYYAADAASDGDSDGIPDSLDPYPNDPSNNTSIWYGGDYWISGVLQSVTPSSPFGYATNAGMGSSDADNDGIWDVVDPFQNDAANNTGWWSGGIFWISGSQTTFNPNTFAYSLSYGLSDQDGDGIPDNADPYLNDGANNTGYWGGGTYMISAALVQFSDARWDLSLVGSLGDLDLDGIPDTYDPFPGDPYNNTAWWSGGPYWIDGVEEILNGGYYAYTYGSPTPWDSDGDGIPDLLDPHASDSSNNTGWWSGGTFTIDGISQQLNPSYAYNSVLGFPDFDGDRIPDAVDPYHRDPYNDLDGWREFILNLNPFGENGTWEEYVTVNEWLDAWFMQDPEQRTFKPKYLGALGVTDSDGDSIPDTLEDFFGLNKLDPADASLDPHNTGWSSLERYLAGQDLRNPIDPLQNWNSDSIPNVWKIRHSFDLFDTGLRYSDPDEDGMVNLMEYLQGTDPNVSDGGEDTDGDGLNEAQELLLGTSSQSIDTDENGVADGDEDYDQDGLTNAMELLLGTNPLIADTDGDGANDGDENNNGSDPKAPDDEPELVDPSTPVVTEVRWIRSSWEEIGGTYHYLYWTWNWNSSTEGGWTSYGGSGQLPRTEVGFATYSAAGSQQQFSDMGSAQAELSHVSSIQDWQVEGPGISVDSTFTENLAPGTPPSPPTHEPDYPNTETHEQTWSDEESRFWNGGAMEMRLAWAESSSAETQKPVTMHFLKIQETNGSVGNIYPYELNLQPGADGSNTTISINANATVAGTTLKESVVPLDIYIVHPNTGEVPEYMEDSNAGYSHETGKGGLVALRRTENTPMTKLVLRPVGGLDSSSRQRIKIATAMFTGKIKVWKDEARTQAVISQQTDFPASEETILYLEGEEVSLTDSLKITQQVSANGSWVDGDSVSTIVVHGEIVVVLRCFIPHKWTSGEGPGVPMGNPLPLCDCIGGNRQNYSTQGYDDEPEFKLAQQLVMTPYRELHATADIVSERKKKSTPSSDYYKVEEDVPESDQELDFGETFVPGASPDWTFVPPAPKSSYENSGRSGKKTYITASLSGEAGSPVWTMGSLPNIDFKYDIEMERMETGGTPYIRVKVTATCNRYPAYEALVEESDGNYVQLYKVKPNSSTLPGPISLNRSFTEEGELVDLE